MFPGASSRLKRRAFVPEGHAIVARRFIAGLAIHRICVPEGRLKLDLSCYQSGVPDRFEVKNSTHPHSEFRRPSGTQILWIANPAINRRATVICPSGTGCQPVSSVDDGWFAFCFEDDGSGSPGPKKPSCLVVRYRVEAYATLLSGLAREVLKSSCRPPLVRAH